MPANDPPNVPSHCHGMPNPESGFIPLHALIHGEQELASTPDDIAKLLGRATVLFDANGYTDEIVAGAVGDNGSKVAWLQCRCKQLRSHVDINFWLYARVDGEAHIEWVPKTYNPFFGINPVIFEWNEGRLRFCYTEKHRTYCALFDAAGRLELTVEADGEFVSEAEAERRRKARIGRRRQMPLVAANRLEGEEGTWWTPLRITLVALAVLVAAVVYGVICGLQGPP